MIHVRFPDQDTEERAIGFLAGRFSFKSFEDGTTLVPEAALGAMASEGITFTVAGPAAYEQAVGTNFCFH
ncbi:MAG TPA: hypothetical protein VHZ24_08280 [Pirellulales bacterium]|jgi:hypothetical protein|nr:hypothetical protein [Pirellulales bacterium]